MTANSFLHAGEKQNIQLGYLQLNDAAPFVIAQALGLFTDYGLNVTLQREVSWANVRDKLASGTLDAAQMLAPLPAMTAMGVSGVRVTLVTGLVLSRNGNAVTLAANLLEDLVGVQLLDASCVGKELSATVVKDISLQQGRKLTFAIVHAFSTHHLLLRRWLRQGGIDPDVDVTTLVIPPSQMADSLKSGVIDGYCVGEPWNTIAVQQGSGVIAALGAHLWQNAPEKLLCVTELWHQRHPNSHLRLRLALMQACDWLSIVDNRLEAAEILASKAFLDLDKKLLLPSLTGKIVMKKGGTITNIPDFHRFDLGAVAAADVDLARALVTESLELLGKSADGEMASRLAERCFKPELYEEAIAFLSASAET
ncbi:MAG: ABC-type nitrate/sulfonate/bicarbonate transport system substrate-binding protein [Candidatus Azotimanducaceae bacterium]|jgi:ABC-type nitrate/sulfonate/bicarbonate transport system substrate-binding protein